MKLLFPESEISRYASYYPAVYDQDMELLVPEVKKRGYLRKSDLLKLSRWLSPRNKSRVLCNSCDSVEEMTALSLRSETERGRIEHSVKLKGLAFTTASAILHWFHSDSYPIWSLHSQGAVSFEWSARLPEQERWEAFVLFCREVVSRNPVDMRTLDRAFRKFRL